MPGTVPTMPASALATGNKTVLLRRAKAQQMADKEAERARKSRLESLLVQKLCVSGTPNHSPPHTLSERTNLRTHRMSPEDRRDPEVVGVIS